MHLLISIVISLIATIFIVLASVAGDISKKSLIVIFLVSFVLFFIISYIFGLGNFLLYLL